MFRLWLNIKLIIALVFLLIIGCNSEEQDYLNEAITIIEKNSIEKYTKDWDEFRSDVLEKAENAKKIEDTYPAIIYAVKKLDDKHSRFKTPEESLISNSPDRPIPDIKSQIITNSIGYIQIPAFKGTDPDRSLKFASLIQSSIKEIDAYNIENWIVDLGNDSGGYVWPMMSGLAPLLGNGIWGYTVDADTNYFDWRIHKGSVYFKNKRYIELQDSYILKNRIKKIAVLISENTASAGEAIAISFKGIDNVCFIGSKTYGVSTGTAGYKLSDGAVLFVVNTKFADRNKNIYGASVEPDIEASDKDAIQTAIEWIVGE